MSWLKKIFSLNPCPGRSRREVQLRVRDRLLQVVSAPVARDAIPAAKTVVRPGS